MLKQVHECCIAKSDFPNFPDGIPHIKLLDIISTMPDQVLGLPYESADFEISPPALSPP